MRKILVFIISQPKKIVSINILQLRSIQNQFIKYSMKGKIEDNNQIFYPSASLIIQLPCSFSMAL